MSATARPAGKPLRTVEDATLLLERVAVIDGRIAQIETRRRAALAAANATADGDALPLLDERGRIVAVLEPWWARAAAALTGGKRKSMPLGGCTIGTKSDRPRLGLAGDDETAIAALQRLRWAKALLRIKPTLDRVAILKALEGRHAEPLTALGFAVVRGETFFVERIAQPGAVSEAA